MERLGRYAIAMVLLCFLMVVASSWGQICGKRKVVNQLVVNGTESKDGDWPWHVAIFHHNGYSYGYMCGGTILDQNIVITAAHCVMTANGIMARERILVHVGRNRLSAGSNRVQEHEVFQLIVHPEYNVNSIKHDIALIKLATDITYNNYVQPICLWNRGEDLNAIVGMKGTVVGFGRDETGNVSDVLREATIPVVSHMTCIESNRNAFAYHLTSNMFCAGNRDGIAACNGDSGGGMFFNYNGTWYIRGVVSFTKPLETTRICDTNEYTVFSDVAKYIKWIEQHLRGTVANSQSTVTRIKNIHKIGLLPMSTCGPNPYASWEELSKPVLSGYPWMGLVELKEAESSEPRTICQATLISDLYLISSALCVKLTEYNRFGPSIRLGEYNMNTTTDCAQVDEQRICSPPVQVIRIESKIIHPSYRQSRRLLPETFNIGLFRLQERANTSWSNVKPICLPVTNKLRGQQSTHYIQTSWLYDSFHDSHRPALERWLREILEPFECQMLLRTHNVYISTCVICSKSNKIACEYGFAGSPLQLVQQVQGESRYVLHGIFMISIGHCVNKLPDLFVNVACHIDWILDNIEV